MDSEIRAALGKIIALDDKLCARGTRLLRAVASEAEDVLGLLLAANDDGKPAAAADPSRDILLRADPSDLCARGTRLLRAVASEAEDALARLPTATIAQIGKIVA